MCIENMCFAVSNKGIFETKEDAEKIYIPQKRLLLRKNMVSIFFINEFELINEAEMSGR